MEFRTRTPSPPQQIYRVRTAQFELGVAGRFARRVAGPALGREQALAQRTEKAEYWRSVGDRRIPPGAIPRRMEQSTSLNAGAMPATWTGVQSLQAPLSLSICNEHPFQFPYVRFEFGRWLILRGSALCVAPAGACCLCFCVFPPLPRWATICRPSGTPTKIHLA
jgi:hypothetical protein